MTRYLRRKHAIITDSALKNRLSDTQDAEQVDRLPKESPIASHGYLALDLDVDEDDDYEATVENDEVC